MAVTTNSQSRGPQLIVEVPTNPFLHQQWRASQREDYQISILDAPKSSPSDQAHLTSQPVKYLGSPDMKSVETTALDPSAASFHPRHLRKRDDTTPKQTAKGTMKYHSLPPGFDRVPGVLPPSAPIPRIVTVPSTPLPPYAHPPIHLVLPLLADINRAGQNQVGLVSTAVPLLVFAFLAGHSVLTAFKALASLLARKGPLGRSVAAGHARPPLSRSNGRIHPDASIASTGAASHGGITGVSLDTKRTPRISATSRTPSLQPHGASGRLHKRASRGDVGAVLNTLLAILTIAGCCLLRDLRNSGSLPGSKHLVMLALAVLGVMVIALPRGNQCQLLADSSYGGGMRDSVPILRDGGSNSISLAPLPAASGGDGRGIGAASPFGAIDQESHGIGARSPFGAIDHESRGIGAAFPFGEIDHESRGIDARSPFGAIDHESHGIGARSPFGAIDHESRGIGARSPFGAIDHESRGIGAAFPFGEIDHESH
ncbi:hypothetical protein SeMB42_g04438 [Synchytrium endobioticum]|nr:hypothetical protein SeMB42_g04438 [Synchytrium endobioticum]